MRAHVWQQLGRISAEKPQAQRRSSAVEVCPHRVHRPASRGSYVSLFAALWPSPPEAQVRGDHPVMSGVGAHNGRASAAFPL